MLNDVGLYSNYRAAFQCEVRSLDEISLHRVSGFRVLGLFGKPSQNNRGGSPFVCANVTCILSAAIGKDV